MVRGSGVLFFCKDAGAGGGGAIAGISKALSDFLVCPLSKQPLRHCPDSKSLVSDAIGVSFPIVNGIPCLMPKDGKVLDDDDEVKSYGESSAGSPIIKDEN